MRHLPVLPSPAVPAFDLDALAVETPCDVSWDSMQGDNRVRYCGQCRQNVYNIEGLPRAEAVRLVSVRQGRLCVRFYRRQDGTVVTADCWDRLRAARRKGPLAFVTMLVLVGAAQFYAMLTGLAGLKRVSAPCTPPTFDGGARTAGLMVRPLPPLRVGEVVGGLPPPPPRHLMGKMRAR